MTAKNNGARISIDEASIDDLYLDPHNPRLGRHVARKALRQDAVLEKMHDWALEELAVSIIESGYWQEEALIVVRQKLYDRPRKIVVEGNRRLAALKLIQKARNTVANSKWRGIIAGASDAKLNKLKRAPYIEKPNRKAVQAYLGFRHVTGIKEWPPAEKAQFIAHLIEDEHLTYEQVRRRIGSKTPTVRQNYISYRLLLQMETRDDIAVSSVEERFSVLYLSLRTDGVQKYLHIDIEAEPGAAQRPVPQRRMRHLVTFAMWLFGDEHSHPIIQDSRLVDSFGKVLLNTKAVEYLERADSPSFDVARRMAGVAETEVARHIETAADEIEEALRAAHQYKKSARVQSAVERVGRDALALLAIFPSINEKLRDDE